MATAAASPAAGPGARHRGGNAPPIIVKKIIAPPAHAHHGGAWKVAYADFVTAMMAFFLLMWLLGATDEEQRKGLADYFAPTLVDRQQGSAGSGGLFGGDSLTAHDRMPHAGAPGGTAAITVPRAAAGDVRARGGQARQADEARFDALARALTERIARRPDLARAGRAIRMTQTRDGLRIDLVDTADFAMFGLGTDRLTPEGRDLLRLVADVAGDAPNPLIVRGHTDAVPYGRRGGMNNWRLSTARAEATRAALAISGIAADRFDRIEGVADREPVQPADPYHASNRRMSVTLGWSR